MKKIGLFLLAIVMMGLGGCSKDDDLDYNFSGRWLVSSQVTLSTCGNTVGWEGEMRIAQSGGEVIVEFPDFTTNPNRIANGTCDTGTGAIQFDVIYPATGSYNRWTGRGVDETRMTGTRKTYGGPGVTCQFEATWTAILIGR